MDFDLQLAVNCTEHFAAASELGCVLSNKDGKVLHACGQNYLSCAICPLAGMDREQGLATHRYGMKAAERFGGKYIYFCTMGLTFFTSPILGTNGAEAQITAGPFLMVDAQDYQAYDLIKFKETKPERIPPIMEAVRKLPYIETQKVNALAELLFMSVAFMNNVSQANRMLETEKSMQIQGQISDYLFRIKQSAVGQPYPYHYEKNFLQALRRGDEKYAQKLLSELLGHILLETGGDMAQIRERTYELAVLISRSMLDTGCDPAYIGRFMHECRQCIPAMQTMEELSLWLSRRVTSIIDVLFSSSRAHHADLIYRTIQYLQSNYTQKITLEDLSRRVYVSPTYLSRVFKQDTGSSIVDYLNMIRIEKSKDLLADKSVSLINVALQSGFESQSYFNHIFKSSCGMTPLQYRKTRLES